MKKNDWLLPSEKQPELVKNHPELNGYLVSETVALHGSSGLHGSYFDIGCKLGTVAPSGDIVSFWHCPSANCDIEHSILGWCPLPDIEEPVNSKPIYKALVAYKVYDMVHTACTFKNMDGIVFTKTLPVTIFNIARWLLGVSIQDAMPSLSADDRELFLTGMLETDF